MSAYRVVATRSVDATEPKFHASGSTLNAPLCGHWSVLPYQTLKGRELHEVTCKRCRKALEKRGAL